MSNRNNKGKNKPNNQSASTVNNHNYVEIDYDKLAEAIVKADDIRAKKIKEAKDLEIKEFKNSLNFKEYDSKYKQWSSNIWLGVKMFFRPAKYSSGKNYTGISGIMITTICLVLLLFEIACYLSIGAVLLNALYLNFEVLFILEAIGVSLMLFMITRISIICRKEVAETKDVQILSTLFMSMIGFTSLVIAVIALVKSGGVS